MKEFGREVANRLARVDWLDAFLGMCWLAAALSTAGSVAVTLTIAFAFLAGERWERAWR